MASALKSAMTRRSRRPQEEGLAIGHLGQLRCQRARFAGEDERGHRGRRASAFLSASASGHSGCCAAANWRQDAGLHEEGAAGSSPLQVNAVGSPPMAAFRFAPGVERRIPPCVA